MTYNADLSRGTLTPSPIPTSPAPTTPLAPAPINTENPTPSIPISPPAQVTPPTAPTTPATPVVNPVPTIAAGWCIPRPSIPDAQLQSNLDYACGQGIDCSPIQPGGACFEPATVVSHAAYAMNLLYQSTGRNPWNCDFLQTATITSDNPSYNSCVYPSGKYMKTV